MVMRSGTVASFALSDCFHRTLEPLCGGRTHLYPALGGGGGNFCINGGVLSITASSSNSEATLSISRICDVLRKDKVDAGDKSSFGFPSLQEEFVERPLPLRLSLPDELCSKAMIRQLDDSGPGLEFRCRIAYISGR